MEANIQDETNHTLPSSIAIQAAWDKTFCLASHRKNSDITLITSYLALEQGEGSILCTRTIMMHARPIRPHEIASLRWQSRSMSVV